MPCLSAPVACLYPCDVTDAEWAYLAPLVPGPARHGRPRCWALQLLVNAIFYVLRTALVKITWVCAILGEGKK
jgi:transposase